MRNYSIKTLIFILVFFLSLVSMCFGQNKESDQDLMSFIDIKDSYATGQPIGFYIQNNSHKPLYYYCTMEKKFNDQWEEFVYSIQAEKISKSVKLRKIEPHKKSKIILDPNKKGFKVFKPLFASGSFRFRLEVLEEIGKETLPVFSKEFTITDEKKKREKRGDRPGHETN